MSERAKCKKCGRHAMVAVNAEDVEIALIEMDAGCDTGAMLSCAYCGGRQWSSDGYELWHAANFDDCISASVNAELKREREKVARLAEGRW